MLPAASVFDKQPAKKEKEKKSLTDTKKKTAQLLWGPLPSDLRIEHILASTTLLCVVT